MSQFVNLFFKKKPFDTKELARIIDAAFADELNEVEKKTKTSFSPSVLGYGSGTCPRRWVMAFRGAEWKEHHTPKDIDVMESGTDRHTRIQKHFEDSALDVTIEYDLVVEDPPIHGFVDVIFNDFNGERIVGEIKTTRTEAFESRKLKNKGPEYQELQLLLYMYFLDIPYGVLIYENNNDKNKMLIPMEMTAENRERVERVVEWMRSVWQAYQDDKLPTRPFRKNSKACKTCPLLDHCALQDKGDIDIKPLDFSEVEVIHAYDF